MSNEYYVVSGDSLRDVADTIRTKGGTSAQLEYPEDWKDAINAISGGGDEPIPDDGKTRIWIHIAEETPDNRLTFYLRFIASTANNTTVDWGDGTSETLGSTTATSYSHKYSQGGDYVIVITVNSGTIAFEGDNNNRIYGSSDNANAYNRSRIIRIVFGDNVTSVGQYSLNACYCLKSITMSNSIISIGLYTFNACYSLISVTISNNITKIESFAFPMCYSLASITIPNSVTTIGTSAFNNCSGMSEYHFKSTTPPKLSNTNAFTGIPSDCIIYVPQGSLSAYQTATNWSSFSSYMQEEPT